MRNSSYELAFLGINIHILDFLSSCLEIGRESNESRIKFFYCLLFWFAKIVWEKTHMDFGSHFLGFWHA